MIATGHEGGRNSEPLQKFFRSKLAVDFVKPGAWASFSDCKIYVLFTGTSTHTKMLYYWTIILACIFFA